MGRNVYVKANGGAPVTLENWEGITFGDLKASMPDVSFNNQRVVIKSTGVDLRDDSAQIPLEGDQFIFCTPDKQNAGGYAEDKAFAKRAFAETDFGRDLFAGYPNIKAEVLAELVEIYNNTVGTSPTTQSTNVDEAVQAAYTALNNLVAAVSSQACNIIGGISLEQLEADYRDFVARTKAGK